MLAAMRDSLLPLTAQTRLAIQIAVGTHPSSGASLLSSCLV